VEIYLKLSLLISVLSVRYAVEEEISFCSRFIDTEILKARRKTVICFMITWCNIALLRNSTTYYTAYSYTNCILIMYISHSSTYGVCKPVVVHFWHDSHEMEIISKW